MSYSKIRFFFHRPTGALAAGALTVLFQALIVQPLWATPAGTNYSVSHQIHGDPDGTGPQPRRCLPIFDPRLPGAQDDIVRFDEVIEFIRRDVFGTTPSVNEEIVTSPGGTFDVFVNTTSPMGTDLFPGGLQNSQGDPFTDVCFVLGADDAMAWTGLNNVLAAEITYKKDGAPLVGPINIPLSSFSNPWNGLLQVVTPNITGRGINNVTLQIIVQKTTLPPTNDRCPDAQEVSNGTHPLTTVGASTDGPDEPETCRFGGESQLRSDVWFEYTSTCTGDVTIDTCASFFDTKLAVYEDCVCPPIDFPIACIDDSPGCGPLAEQSRTVIPTQVGNCLLIRIGGFLGDQGPGTLRLSCAPGSCCRLGDCTDGQTRTTCEAGGGEWISGAVCSQVNCPSAPPVNDLCENCIPLTTGVPVQRSSEGAGGANISTCGGSGDSADVWHCWTADCTGRVEVSLCESSFDTTLAVFDGCQGQELACSDDDCPGNRSLAVFDAQEGQDYFFRVAGFQGAAGAYTITVNDCEVDLVTCCIGACRCVPHTTVQLCEENNGRVIGLGNVCRADHNGNFCDDACEDCPGARILAASPVHETVDARQPHPSNSLTPRQGIGRLPDPIFITLTPPAPFAQHCFELCETAIPVEGANSITSVTPAGPGRYRILLAHPITTSAVTTIRYLGSGFAAEAFVEYTSHPANVNADAKADANDISDFIECCLNGECQPPHGKYSCDLDHSGAYTTADLATLIDLLNGGDRFNPTLNTNLPQNVICPEFMNAAETEPSDAGE